MYIGVVTQPSADDGATRFDDMTSGGAIEVPKRLTPTTEVTRELYLKSGNRCYFPGCDEPLMRANGVLVGKIAHIEGAMPGSARFRESMSNEERRAFSNLILVCGNHHDEIDHNAVSWPVQDLQRLKFDHEAIYSGAVDQLRQQVGDVTAGTTYIPAKNLKALDPEIAADAEALEGSLAAVHGFAERLARVPVGARSVLLLISIRGDPAAVLEWRREIEIPVPVLRAVADCSWLELQGHLDVLEHADLAFVDHEPFEGPPLAVICNSTGPEIGWTFLKDLIKAVDHDATVLRRLLVDLDFSVLDA
jgi:hypothetical protein